MENNLQTLLSSYKGTTSIIAPIAIGVKAFNLNSYDCHCSSDDCYGNDCYDCHCSSNDCTDCYDCHCSSNDCASDCMGPQN